MDETAMTGIHLQQRRIPGAEGYAERAPELIQRWQSLSFTDRPQPVLDLVPAAPADILDIGAGIGTDASALAALGHRVTAVEPTMELLQAGRELHKQASIAWVVDSLPCLAIVTAQGKNVDLVLLSAVWMHLDAVERQQAMPVIAALLRPTGRMIMSLRHGPVAQGRRMFAVSAAETIGLARLHGLQPLLHLETDSVQPINRQAGVTWSHLAFSRQ